jgi:hypothetical protein
MQSWLAAAAGARSERSKVQSTWETNNAAFLYCRPGIIQVHISLDALRQMVHDNERKLLQLFDDLLPSGFDISAIDQLPWNTLHDDGSPDESFIDAPDTWNTWLADAIVAIKNAYLDERETRHHFIVKGKPCLKSMNRLLILDLEFQGVVVGTLVGNTGVAPRAVGMRDYRYRSDGKEKRNLYLRLSSVVLAGGRQKGESRRNGEREFVMRAFAPLSGECLVRYLALVRQAIIEILRENNWHTEAIPAYTTRILAKPPRNTGCGAWEVSQITDAWHTNSAPYIRRKVSIVDARQITTAIYKRLFPEFLKAQSLPTAKTTVDGQGDHGGEPGSNHYGLSNDIFFGHSELETDEYIMTSRVYHTLMHMFCLDPNWPKAILGAQVFDVMQHEQLATQVARRQIVEQFGFSRMQPADVRIKVHQLCLEFHSSEVGFT